MVREMGGVVLPQCWYLSAHHPNVKVRQIQPLTGSSFLRRSAPQVLLEQKDQQDFRKIAGRQAFRRNAESIRRLNSLCPTAPNSRIYCHGCNDLGYCVLFMSLKPSCNIRP